jgi:hypothetical protein
MTIMLVTPSIACRLIGQRANMVTVICFKKAKSGLQRSITVVYKAVEVG